MEDEIRRSFKYLQSRVLPLFGNSANNALLGDKNSARSLSERTAKRLTDSSCRRTDGQSGP